MFKSAPTYIVDIFIAGDIGTAKSVCRAFCFRVGLCVTVQPVDFIYTGGEESGVKIGLTNYPRFPTAPEKIFSMARDLAIELRAAMHQHSVLVRDDGETIWDSLREPSV